MFRTKWMLLIVLIGIFIGSGNVHAMVPYKTYSYDYEGHYFVSPDAYVPGLVLDARDLGIGNDNLDEAEDLVVDSNNNVYIADSGKNRILILDPDYRLKKEITGFQREDGSRDEFSAPAGIYVNKEGLLYIADSKNSRIVVLKPDGSLVRTIEAPDSDVLPAGFVYEPSALAVDPTGRMYVISKSTNMGVIALNSDGDFDGFVGAEKVAPKIVDLFWKVITTKEQKIRTAKNVPTEYNNITIDHIGFPYVTSSAIDAQSQYQALVGRDTSSLYAPIKRLNNLGVDILKRNGAFPPAGDVERSDQVSRFIDVALAEDGVYSTLDTTQKKIFTYDNDGNLLYIFGGYGSQDGVFQNPSALAYQGSNLLVLDKGTGNLTVFKRTEYGDSIATAIHLRIERKYDESIAAWQEVLKKNPGFEPAYTGAAQSNMRNAEYREAMHNYKLGNDWEHYYKAFAEYRKEIVRKTILWIPIMGIVILWLLSRAFKYVKKVNASGWRKQGERTLWEELLFSFHIMFHPFDGFWDLKHEKRGSVRAAVIIVALVMAVDIFKTLAGGYVLNPTDIRVINLNDTVLQVLVPFCLWCWANWGLTTLMDGEGSLKEIFISSAYALMPIVILNIPVTLLSNVVVLQEAKFVTIFSAFAYIWAFSLIFVGILVTNDYSPLKNLLTSAVSVVGMGFMAFLAVLFMNILQKMNIFVTTIINEITFRM